MGASDADKMVAATLAAAKIAIDKPEKLYACVLIYERILKIMEKRSDKADEDAEAAAFHEDV